MSLPRYPEYRDSGVAWLGSTPQHWAIVQSRRYFKDRNERARESDRQLTASQKHGMLYQADFMQMEGQKVTQVILGADILKHVEPNDFVISMRSFQGGLEWCGLQGCMSSAYVALTPNESIYPPFFAHLFKSGPYIQALQATTNLVRDGQALRFSNFAQVPLPLMPLQEQQAIAAFLDHETAKIDGLIAEQEKLIALLAEKRQATISHAVTRGLNPQAPMKDSGVPWLGEVPAHWEMKRLKNISPFITVGIVVNPSDYVAQEGLPFIYGGDIAEGRIDTENCRRITPAGSDSQPKTRLRPGDLLTVRVGAPGVTAVVPEECAGGNCASVMLVRKGDSNSDWLCYAMNSRMVRFQVEVVQYGAAQEQFNISHAINFWIATPPLNEQEDIALFLNAQLSKLEELSSQSVRGIELLKERRSALIAAAVTGQIDVRQALPDTA